MKTKKNKAILLVAAAVIILLVSVFALLYLFRDKKEDLAADTYSKTGNVKLSEITFSVSDKITDTAFYGENAYAVSDEGITAYSLVTGKQSDFAVERSSLTTVCVSETAIYTYDKAQYAVLVFDLSGNITATYDFSQEQLDVREMKIHNDTLAICSAFANANGYFESRFHKINIQTGEIQKIQGNFMGTDSYCFVDDFEFQNESTLLIAGRSTMSAAGDSYKLYRFDLKKEETLFECEVPYFDSAFYDNKSGTYYYSSGRDINKYDFEIMNGVKISTTSKADYKSDEIDEFYLFFDKIVCNDNNYILWSQRYNLIIVKEPLVTDQSIVIYKPKFIGDLNKLTPVINQFKSEYNCEVYIVEYENDKYTDKLRTKLLANDTDFDIFILIDPTAEMLLYSILTNGAYEPLNEYSGVVENFSLMFDGYSDIMAYNGNMFAVPMDISPVGCYAVTENFQKYGYDIPGQFWTYDDLWALCDEMLNKGQDKLTVFPYNVYHRFIADFAQNAVNTGNLDKTALTNLMSQVKKYESAGVLFGDVEDGNEYLLNYTYDYNYFRYFVFPDSYDSRQPYPENGITQTPSVGGTNYSVLHQCVMINKSSQNKAMAAKFLEVLTNETYLYTKDVFTDTLLASDLEKHEMYGEWGERELSYLNKAGEMLKGSKLYTIDHMELGSYVFENVRDDFFNGTIPLNEATDLIYNYIYYLCFE